MAEPEEPGDRLGKKTELIVLDPAAGSMLMLVPAMIAAAGERAALRFIDFFTANRSRRSIRRIQATRAQSV
jgi:hypothetical protein